MNRKFVGCRTALVAPLLILLGGCVSMDENPQSCDGPPPPGKPCQITAAWDHDVQFTADPVHGGAQITALAGRVYLFGPEIKYPMTGDGSLTVLAFDGKAPADAPPLQVWQFDPATLARLVKHDMVGWGYTLPLVWPDMPHSLCSVRLKVCYQPPKGSPLYCEGAPMTIEYPGPGSSYVQPAAHHGN